VIPRIPDLHHGRIQISVIAGDDLDANDALFSLEREVTARKIDGNGDARG
jgi:hypothetical protein